MPTYHPHPAVAHLAAMVENLPVKTGKTVEDWAALVTTEGPADDKERKAWLKAEFGLGGPTSMLILNQVNGTQADFASDEAYLAAAPRFVDDMYSGKKAHLRPIHDALIARVEALGEDVKISPATTMVPVYRHHVFAQVRPATNSRVDLGLGLGRYEEALPKRIIETGGAAKGDRITHRIGLEAVEDIDDEVVRWLETAYALDA